MWSGTLLGILQSEEPDLKVSRDDIRPFIRSGFPWHSPDVHHPETADPDVWWENVNPLFESALLGLSVLRKLPSDSRVVMVGDNMEADVGGAEKIGIPSILVRRPGERPTIQAETLEGVPTHLEMVPERTAGQILEMYRL